MPDKISLVSVSVNNVAVRLIAVPQQYCLDLILVNIITITKDFF